MWDFREAFLEWILRWPRPAPKKPATQEPASLPDSQPQLRQADAMPEIGDSKDRRARDQ